MNKQTAARFATDCFKYRALTTCAEAGFDTYSGDSRLTKYITGRPNRPTLNGGGGMVAVVRSANRYLGAIAEGEVTCVQPTAGFVAPKPAPVVATTPAEPEHEVAHEAPLPPPSPASPSQLPACLWHCEAITARCIAESRSSPDVVLCDDHRSTCADRCESRTAAPAAAR